MTDACAACCRASSAADLAPHQALERMRNARDGAVRSPEPPFVAAEVLERSPRYTSFLVTRQLCPVCLALVRSEEEEERSGMRRLTVYAALAAIVAFAAVLLFPRVLPHVAAWLSLKRSADSKPWMQNTTSGVPPPYKPPFPASMPTAS